MITGYCHKQLNLYRSDLTRSYNSTMVNDQVLPTWFPTAKTTLLPRNTDKHVTKNCSPKALLNMLYKIYTFCINMFLTDHIPHNMLSLMNKQQLVINKSTLKKVENSRRNLVTVWLDYRKAFDSFLIDGYYKP